MKQNDFYEVDGCTDFIPVKLIKEHKHMINTLELKMPESGLRTFAPSIYSFPKVNEHKKVAVPKFVAEWIEWCKANDVTLLGGISPIDELGSTICSEKRVKSRDATRWAKQNQETFARAWLDGYEIEQEKLYTVEIGGVGSNKLFKNTRKNKYIFHSGKGLEGYTDKLTEQEIKKADERLWEFAKPVEDK